jgi:hypothetical protein
VWGGGISIDLHADENVYNAMVERGGILKRYGGFP